LELLGSSLAAAGAVVLANVSVKSDAESHVIVLLVTAVRQATDVKLGVLSGTPRLDVSGQKLSRLFVTRGKGKIKVIGRENLGDFHLKQIGQSLWDFDGNDTRDWLVLGCDSEFAEVDVRHL
jgi:hypothetical protein